MRYALVVVGMVGVALLVRRRLDRDRALALAYLADYENLTH